MSLFRNPWAKAAKNGTWVVATVAGFVLPKALHMPVEAENLQKLSAFIVTILTLTLFGLAGGQAKRIWYRKLSLQCLALGMLSLLLLIFVHRECTCHCYDDEYRLKGFIANSYYPDANSKCQEIMVRVTYHAEKAWIPGSIGLCNIGLILFFVGTICAFSTSLVAAIYSKYKFENGEFVDTTKPPKAGDALPT